MHKEYSNKAFPVCKWRFIERGLAFGLRHPLRFLLSRIQITRFPLVDKVLTCTSNPDLLFPPKLDSAYESSYLILTRLAAKVDIAADLEAQHPKRCLA